MDTFPDISPEHALQYAPDDSSVKAAKKLASISQWRSLRLHATADGTTVVWGEIQGSSLYRSSIILVDKVAFACDCPSFKRPCKHGLALLVCYAQSRQAFQTGDEPPPWVDKHLAKHGDSAAKQAEKAAKPAKVVDEAAQAKRVAAREKKVDAGVNELQLWLADLLRGGLAQAKTLAYSHFSRMKERLIDAQAPGLAGLVDGLQSALAQPDWQQAAAAQAGRLQLLLSAHERLDALPAPLQAEVRAQIGWTTPQDQVLAGPPAQDTWLVVGHRDLEADNNVRYRRQWLWGVGTDQPALVLAFAAGFQNLGPALPLALTLPATVCWFPGAWPQRVAIREQGPLVRPDTLPELGYATLDAALAQQAEALAVNPFQVLLPWLLRDVTVQRHQERWWLRDRNGQAVPAVIPGDIWPLLALAGGHPLTVFGEWDGQVVTALSAWQDEEAIAL